MGPPSAQPARRLAALRSTAAPHGSATRPRHPRGGSGFVFCSFRRSQPLLPRDKSPTALTAAAARCGPLPGRGTPGAAGRGTCSRAGPRRGAGGARPAQDFPPVRPTLALRRGRNLTARGSHKAAGQGGAEPLRGGRAARLRPRATAPPSREAASLGPREAGGPFPAAGGTCVRERWAAMLLPSCTGRAAGRTRRDPALAAQLRQLPRTVPAKTRHRIPARRPGAGASALRRQR